MSRYFLITSTFKTEESISMLGETTVVCENTFFNRVKFSQDMLQEYPDILPDSIVITNIYEFNNEKDYKQYIGEITFNT
jgi:hypothetical protein